MIPPSSTDAAIDAGADIFTGDEAASWEDEDMLLGGADGAEAWEVEEWLSTGALSGPSPYHIAVAPTVFAPLDSPFPTATVHAPHVAIPPAMHDFRVSRGHRGIGSWGGHAINLVVPSAGIQSVSIICNKHHDFDGELLPCRCNLVINAPMSQLQKQLKLWVIKGKSIPMIDATGKTPVAGARTSHINIKPRLLTPADITPADVSNALLDGISQAELDEVLAS